MAKLQTALTFLLLTVTAYSATAQSNDRKVVALKVASGTAQKVVGSIRGYQYTDYQLKLGAGQTLSANYADSNRKAHFGVLPPGTTTTFMHNGTISGDKVLRRVPVDGIYTIRVFMMANEARRGSTAKFTLMVGVSGKALMPLKASADALIPGTPYHASTDVTVMLDGKSVSCPAYVIRRSMDGTATVEVRLPDKTRRRVLFEKGKPVASDSIESMTAARKGDETVIQFGSVMTVGVPDALVFGG